MVRPLAPTERNIAISRRRSFSVVRIEVRTPINPTAMTNPDTIAKARSTIETVPHNWLSATPGITAVSGSWA